MENNTNNTNTQDSVASDIEFTTFDALAISLDRPMGIGFYVANKIVTGISCAVATLAIVKLSNAWDERKANKAKAMTPVTPVNSNGQGPRSFSVAGQE